MSYSWPGNVRELENALHSASVVSKGKRILAKDLPSNLSTNPESFAPTHPTKKSATDIEVPQEANVTKEGLFGTSTTNKIETFTTSNSFNSSVPPPSSISLVESFDISYAHLRCNESNINLLEEMEKEIIRGLCKNAGEIR